MATKSKKETRTAVRRGPTSDDPYDSAASPIVPWCAYFYYVKIKSKDPLDRKIVGYYYDHQNPITDIIQTVKSILAPNALADADFPPKIGYRFDAVKWRRKSYLVILVDGPLKFAHRLALQFMKPSGYADNHTFRDADDGTIDVDVGGRVRTMSLFHCVNYLCDKDGTPLGDGIKERFRFELGYDKAVRAKRVKGAKGFPPEADGGTNMGPPSPPPAAPY